MGPFLNARVGGGPLRRSGTHRNVRARVGRVGSRRGRRELAGGGGGRELRHQQAGVGDRRRLVALGQLLSVSPRLRPIRAGARSRCGASSRRPRTVARAGAWHRASTPRRIRSFHPIAFSASVAPRGARAAATASLASAASSVVGDGRASGSARSARTTSRCQVSRPSRSSPSTPRGTRAAHSAHARIRARPRAVRAGGRQSFGDPRQGIDERTQLPARGDVVGGADLEMQMIGRGVARASDARDPPARLHALADSHADRLGAQVRVRAVHNRAGLVAVREHDVESVVGAPTRSAHTTTPLAAARTTPRARWFARSAP